MKCFVMEFLFELFVKISNVFFEAINRNVYFEGSSQSYEQYTLTVSFWRSFLIDQAFSWKLLYNRGYRLLI